MNSGKLVPFICAQGKRHRFQIETERQREDMVARTIWINRWIRGIGRDSTLMAKSSWIDDDTL